MSFPSSRDARTCLIFLVGSLMSSAYFASAENWSAWRGPRGDGTSLETNVPTRWSSTQNIVWKTEIAGSGHSSPIVWNDRIFTATALPDSQERALVCVDGKTGRILWQKTVLRSPLEAKNGENSYASCTPATDGAKVYVCFLDIKTIVVAAYDFEGHQLWLARPGEFQNDHGFSSSPILYDDEVVLSAQGKQGNFLVALSRTNGRVVWKKELENPSNSFGQPLIRVAAGRPQLVLCGDKTVTSFDPRDGSRIWYTDNSSTDFVITPVFNEKEKLLLATSSWPQRELQAIRPDGKGNVTGSAIAWKSRPGAPYVPSPISVGSYFLTISASGEAFCFEAATGQVAWREKVGGTHASPVSAAGNVYFLNDKGVTQVVKPSEKYELLATNDLGEKCYASPAISGGRIFIRGARTLFCIGN